MYRTVWLWACSVFVFASGVVTGVHLAPHLQWIVAGAPVVIAAIVFFGVAQFWFMRSNGVAMRALQDIVLGKKRDAASGSASPGSSPAPGPKRFRRPAGGPPPGAPPPQ